MKKELIIFLAFLLFLYPISAANMYNHVYNGSSWVPALSTADGQQKYWIQMNNATYGNVVSNLTVGEDVKISGNLNVSGISYIGQKINFFLGETIDNLIDGWVRITGNLNVTGEVSVSGDLVINNTDFYVNVTSGVVSMGGDVTIGRQKITGLCPVGWIMVPGNSSLGTIDFCVMKYEASARDGVAQSILGGTPWVSITQTSAIAECKEVGAHLCTTQEVLTILRDIEQQTSNWQGGAVGTGCMFGGHMDNNPANALATSTDDDSYSGTTDTADEAAVCPFDLTDGGKASRRTFTLSNGEVIWDWSGNVWEWTINTCTAGTGTGAWDGTASWQEWDVAVLDDYERVTIGSQNSAWNSSNGIGKYYGCTIAGNTFIRGGAWNAGALAGAFALFLDNAPSYSFSYVGFRCCK